MKDPRIIFATLAFLAMIISAFVWNQFSTRANAEDIKEVKAKQEQTEQQVQKINEFIAVQNEVNKNMLNLIATMQKKEDGG